MNDCRVQAARKRKNLPDFPCRPVGLVEYANFARAVDPRIRTRCIACPPDDHPEEYFCAWEFWLEGGEGAADPLPTESRLASVLKSPEHTFALLKDLAKRWLAHDGLWFQAVEKEYGLAAATKLDTAAWAKFTVLEAEKIRQFLALPLRLDWVANQQEIIDGDENKVVFRTNVCRVQAARHRKNLAFFRCLVCPPDDPPGEYYCAWEFSI